jgi:hypothetical protein
MNDDEKRAMESVNALVDEYRTRCLWFLREDYYPATPTDALRILQYIERYGDVPAFQKAATLRQWLLQNSSVPSAA